MSNHEPTSAFTEQHEIRSETNSIRPRINELQTRFIYPFYFEPEVTSELHRQLVADTFIARSGKTFSLWEEAEPHDMYLDELLEPVQLFLFSNSRRDGCRYLKLSAEAADAWFGGLEVGIPAKLSINLVAGPRIEIFLSAKALGVLSVALALVGNRLGLEEACRFNYTIGQFKRRGIARLRRRHPSDDAGLWEKIPSNQQARISPAPDVAAPLLDRLGSIYTVARVGTDVDFGNTACRHDHAALLSSLAQMEEPEHAGEASEILSIPNIVLNRKHWAAVGQLGTGHLIADQLPPPGREDHSFNEQRLPLVRDKYFIPYLVTLFQKLALNRAGSKAQTVLNLTRDRAVERLDSLRRDLFEFGVSGHFAQVSIRDAPHRFYRLAQQGLDIPSVWQNIREAVSDLEAKYSSKRQAEMAERQSEMANDMANNLGAIAAVQRLLHLIEYLLASVYVAHLWHMFRGGEHENNWEIGLSAVLGFIGIFLINRFLERRHRSRG